MLKVYSRSFRPSQSGEKHGTLTRYTHEHEDTDVDYFQGGGGAYGSGGYG